MWIGINDRKTEGKFEWIDGSSSTYTNWHQGPPKQPDDWNNNEDCVYMKKDGTWADIYCEWYYPIGAYVYICKKPETSKISFFFLSSVKN